VGPVIFLPDESKKKEAVHLRRGAMTNHYEKTFEGSLILVLKKVSVDKAAGMVLGHDITQIIPGVKKGPLFRKGHVVTEKDIPQLLSIGKEHLYLWEQRPGLVHEDEAALRLAEAAVGRGEGLKISAPKEGKVSIAASADGLLKIDPERLAILNALGEIIMATAHTNRTVRKGETVAGTRIIPLVMEEEKIKAAEVICASPGPLIRVLPYRSCRAGLIITGSEIIKGRIEDGFGPVMEEKLAGFGVSIISRIYVGDERDRICAAIESMLAGGVDLVIVTGGMSVDPDDVTPGAIRDTGAAVVSYGVPVLPGAMFMLAYLKDKPVMGLPGCMMYNGVTVFDIILPRILAGEKFCARDLVSLGHGGLCLNCPVCHYPNCALGKGV
jgi:molybdenum cofactor synthesis domain-containing protein